MSLFLLYTLGGFILLFAGGEAVLKGAVGTAKKLDVSPLLIGLTIISTGTSLPELVVTVNASLLGMDDVALGNIIGSNIANTLLILGVGGIITTIVGDIRSLNRDGVMMMLATLLFALLATFGLFNLIGGIIMLLALAGYLRLAYRQEKSRRKTSLLVKEVEEISQNQKSLWLYLCILAFGIGAVLYGADIFVEGAVGIARHYNVSEAAIGLTLVALGTSLPELATVIPAALRRHTDVIIGNIIGSNIFNLLAIAGVASIVSPLKMSSKMLTADVAVLIGVTLLFLGLMFWRKGISRLAAGLLLACYCIYVYIQFV